MCPKSESEPKLGVNFLSDQKRRMCLIAAATHLPCGGKSVHELKFGIRLLQLASMFIN